MRGKYKSGQRRVVTGSTYKIVIAAIAVLAVALVLLLLAFLPAVEDEITVPRTIVSIESEQSAIGMSSKPSLLYVKVTYSDGTTDTVPLSETNYTGLDLSTEGTQKVALSYGGFEQIIEFHVQNVDCVLEYEAGQGGSVSGETKQYVANGGTGAAVRAVPERGYVFVGWDDGYPNALRQDTGVTANIKHIAKFEKAQYVVRFYLPDGTVATEEVVQYQSRPTKVPSAETDPRMKVYGYKFVGWVPNDYSEITRDTDIFPSYERTATDVFVTIPSDIYGNAMGEISDTSSDMLQYYAHDETATITVKPYNSREFAYWLVTDTDGNSVRVDPMDTKTIRVGIVGNELTFESNSSGSSKTEYVLSFTPNDDIEQINVQAIFAYSSSTITFVNYQNPANGNVEFTVENLTFGDSIGSRFSSGTIPDPADVVGMSFDYWYVLGDETQTKIDGTETFQQPATLVAKWTRKQYIVKFVWGEKTFHEISVSYQDTLASGIGRTDSDSGVRFDNGFPSRDPQNTNYRFVGWQDQLTGIAVDAKTALYAASEHVANADFTENNTLYYIPIWEPIKHVLSVGVEGSGGVKLVENPNVFDTDHRPLEKVEDVFGERVIEQDKKYALLVEAAEGYKIKRIIWHYDDAEVINDYSNENITETQFNIFEDKENYVLVEFEVIKLKVKIKNGTPDYYGHVYYGDAETPYSADLFDLTVNYNANAKLKIESYNETYSIEDIRINGVSIGDVFDETLSYTLVLPQIKEEVTVEIVYSTRKYRVEFHLGNGGSAYIIDLFDQSVKTEIGDYAEYEYAYGTLAYFKIEAQNDFSARKILRSIRYNGELIELFTNNAVANLTLYGWDINDEPYGIGLSYINGYYYYDYGTVNYGGVDYTYCEDIDRRETKLFIKTEIRGETVYGELSEGAENYDAVLGFARIELNVAAKTVSNTSISRDRRITALSFRLSVVEHGNFNFGFDDIGYEVTAVADDKGDVVISNANPSYMGSSVLTATPKSGYYVSGYRINGGEVVPVHNNKEGEKIRLQLDGIACDSNVEFIFETITYRITVLDKQSSGAVKVFGGGWNGATLNNSLSQSFDYHSFVEIVIRTDGNKRIASLTVEENGKDTVTPIQTHINMTEYTLTLADVKADVTVTVGVADLEISEFDGDLYSLIWEKRDSEYTVSAKYLKVDADTPNDNVINVSAAYGRKLTSVELIDGDGVSMSFTDEVRGLTEKFGLRVPNDVFANGAAVEVRVFTEVIKYNVTVAVEGGIGGDVSPKSGSFDYNMDARFTVIADTSNDLEKGHHHIESFKINGEEISFNSAAWSALTYDASTGHYTYGIYTARVVGDMDITVKFAKDTFKISVDEMSVNGSTVLSLEDGVAEYAPYGAKLHINMKADVGYHIAGLYINDVLVTDMDYSAGNDFTEAAYTYNGTVVNGVETGGVTERLRVRVAYEINRYGFNFNIVNASDNFSGDLSSGTFYSTDGLTLSGNRYTGIEHGSNFSFDVKPTVSNGYYLYSVSITYVNGVQTTETMYYDYTDGVFSSKGGTIWFNRFVEADGVTTGVIGDIELIEVTFKRNYYQLTFGQSSDDTTGAMQVKFSHPNGAITEAILFDGDGNQYYYRASDNVFYQRVDGVLVATDIRAVYKDGNYVYTDGTKEYEIFIEHGLRYSVEVTPAEGFETISFTINGDDASGLLNENRYSTNLVRTVSMSATFRKLVYDVSFTVTVSDKSLTSTIATQRISDYARVSVVLLEGEVYDLDYNLLTDITDGYEFELPTGKNMLMLSALGGGYKLGYGTRIGIIMYPNFDGTGFGDGGKGYYVYSLYYGDEEIDVGSERYGDTKVKVIYAGSDGSGINVVSDISARTSFRIMRYNVNVQASYIENIKGESANLLSVEQGSDVAWGEEAFVRIDRGAGYDYADIGAALTVVRGVRNVNAAITVSLDGWEDEVNGVCYYENKADDLGRERDGVAIKDIKSDIDVVAVFERERHTVRYVFNDADQLEKVDTVINDDITYPKIELTGSKENLDDKVNNWSADANGIINVYSISAHYYDELSAVFKPRNGYEIVGNYVNVKAVENINGEWVAVKDASGDEIVYTLGLSEIAYANSDEKSFDFRDSIGLSVAYDLEINLEIRIKTYDLNSAVNRVDATNNINVTGVNVLSKDEYGEDILLADGTYQGGQILERDKAVKTMTAQHHGYILYMFDTPEGYALSRLTVNGRVYSESDLRTESGIDNGSLKYTATYMAGEKPFYRYVIQVTVNDETLNGAGYGRLSRLDVALEILPIAYEVKTYINGVVYDNKPIDTSSGVTDDKTLTVLTPSKVEHFNNLVLRPAVNDGYEITGLAFRTGSSSAATDDALFSTASAADRKTLGIINGNMPYVNVLKDSTTIHIYYTTRIKSYAVAVNAYAYTVDNSVASNGGGYVALNSKAGVATVEITTGDEAQKYLEGSRYEYFSNVKVEAYALGDYRLYGIVEIITNADGSETEWQIVNGQRGITYVKNTDVGGRTTETFTYSVGAEGSRRFKLIYKQEMRITVSVPNPYKYMNGRHIGYVELNAYEDGVRLTNVSEAALNAAANEYVYEYAYDVLVGNFISFTYSEIGGTSALKQPAYCTYDSKTGVYTDKLLAPNEQYPNAGIGLYITEKTDLFIVNDVNGRIGYSKTTFGAVETNVGGSIVFGVEATEPRNDYYDVETTVGRKITVTIKPEISNRARYAFSKLYIRQVDIERSKASRQLIFKEGEEEWLQCVDEYADLYGYKVVQGRNSDGDVTFTIDMRGDIYIRAEFYRIYELEYGTNYTDVGEEICDYTDENAAIKLESVIDNEYGKQYQGDPVTGGADDEETAVEKTKYYVQYRSSFDLIAPEAKAGYRFVGWYVNGVNAYSYLAQALPGKGYLKMSFNITVANTAGLITNGVENMKLKVIAMYQPVIEIAVINELYYYNDETQHWNSWDSGLANVSANVFVDNETDPTLASVPGAATLQQIDNSSSVALGSRNYGKLSDLKYANMHWDLLEDDIARYELSEELRVHTATGFFKVLYQSISNGDFLNDSWKNGVLDLSLVGMPYSVKFQRWQYYNWKDGVFVNIGYAYRDVSDSQRDSSSASYRLALEYLFESADNMPYAISSSKADNSVNDRPLIIRPKFQKVVEVNLSQLAFTKSLSGDATSDFRNVMQPRISSYSNAPLYHSISTDELSGMFDYGATVNIKYFNQLDTYGEIVNYKKSDDGKDIDEKFRFIGWRLNWTVGSDTEFRIISTDDTINGLNLPLTYNFGDAPPNEAMELEALFIKQFRNSLYSYNVAYSDENYGEAEKGIGAYQNAPTLTVTAKEEFVTFATYDRASNTTDFYDVYYTLSADDEGNVFGSVEGSRKWVFMGDVGATYDVKVNRKNPTAGAANDSDVTPGYNPNFDQEYKVYYNKNSKIEGEERVITVAGGYEKGTITITSMFKLDVQYASTVKLQLNNLMYNAGIVVPEELAEYITNGERKTLTVWDNDSYGEPNLAGTEIGTGKVDGTVVIKIKLVNVNSFGGKYDYALKGFKNGVGIKSTTDLSYWTKFGDITELFSAKEEGFKRAIEIDYSSYITGGTLMFGKDNWTGEGSKYSAANTGDGTETNPYNIYNAVQLRNVGIYFAYNEHTCKGVHFRLRDDIMLEEVVDLSNTSTVNRLKNQGINITGNPALSNVTTQKAWTPICHYYDSTTNTHYGFDGVLTGKRDDAPTSTDADYLKFDNNYYIYGLAADSNSFRRYNDENDPMTDEDFINYSELSGYGIFGCINGGTIDHVNIGNAYVDLLEGSSSFGSLPGTASYIGILTARAYNGIFTNIKFDENSSLGRTTLTNASGGIQYSRVYLNCITAEGVGMLAGYAEDSTIKDVKINVSNQALINVELSTSQSAGALCGIFRGSRGSVDNLSTDTYVDSSLAYRGAFATGVTVVGAETGARLLIDVATEAMNTGGLFGMIADGADVTNVKIDKASVLLGSSMAFNVGGIVGCISNARLVDPTVISGNTSSRSTINNDIILATTIESEIGGETMGNLNSYTGKAGGIAGLALTAKLQSDPAISQPSIQGVIFFRGATYGGIVGVAASKTLVQGFNLRSPTYSDSNGTLGRVYLMFELQSTAKMSGGGIVGANLSNSIVDDCSIMGQATTAITEQSGTNLTGSVIYVYRDSDAYYQTLGYHERYQCSKCGYISEYTLPNNGECPYWNDHSGKNDKEKKDYQFIMIPPSNIRKGNVITGESVFVGGIVGYNTAQVYNSFTQGTRITVKYENNGSASAVKAWQVFAGGIVGYFNVVDVSFTYYGLGEIVNGFSKTINSYCRVQSCYTRNSSIALMGYVWCDGPENDDTQAPADSRGVAYKNVPFTIGGIVGGTSTNRYGQYAINSCYTYYNTYILRLGAYGRTDKTDENKETPTARGWYATSTYDPAKFKTYKRFQPFRPGIYVDGFIYGIVSPNDKSDVSSSANHCWSIGNTGIRHTPQSNIMISGEEDVTSFGLRGVEFTDADTAGSVTANRSGANEAWYSSTEKESAYWQSNHPNTGLIRKIGPTGNTVDVYLSQVGITFSGGIAGVYDKGLSKSTDGRVYKTDITTGQTIVGHEATINDIDGTASWYRIENGTYIINASGDGMNETYYAYLNRVGNSTVNGMLVRGQGASKLPG